MKDTFLDANFPKTSQGRVYHLGIRAGEVANRVITVGSPSRAEAIAQLLDIVLLKLSSERGFLTITGRFQGVPVSIVSIGMGYPNMDFFVREVRECVQGDLVLIRLGSCGGLSSLPVGSVVVPAASVSIRRNYDFDFLEASDDADDSAYEVSKPVYADAEVHSALASRLRSSHPPGAPVTIDSEAFNASADSFYASQGRITSFPDHNENIITKLLRDVPRLASLEMETFHLFHLASVWRPRSTNFAGHAKEASASVPPTTAPVMPTVSVAPSVAVDPIGDGGGGGVSVQPTSTSTSAGSHSKDGARIRAAAVQMIFAQRLTQDFIEPQRVAELEAWSGKVVLETLIGIQIAEENIHGGGANVWD